MTIQLVVADYHPLMLQGMEYLFRTKDDFNVIALCNSAREAMEAVQMHRPDVLVLATNIPGNESMAIVHQLQADNNISTRIVLYMERTDEDQIMDAMRSGVGGIVFKEMDPQLLLLCIRKVHGGEQWRDRNALELSLRKMLLREANAHELASILTTRENDLLCLVAEGLSNEQIAEKECISSGTVKAHLRNISKKLNLKNRVALVRFAQEKVLVDSTSLSKKY